MNNTSGPNQPQQILQADRLGRVVGGKTILADVSFPVMPGEMLGIVGASGSGKSSLLRLLNRLDEPTSGTVFLDGTDYRQLPPRELRRRVGMVTQRPFLFPGDVAFNLRFGPAQRGENLADDEVTRLLEQVGLPDFASRDTAGFLGPHAGKSSRGAAARRANLRIGRTIEAGN